MTDGQGGGPWIAWVEDDPSDRELVESILREHGLRERVRMFPDGPALLAALAGSARADPPSAYVLDMKMPRMDGFELLRNLRQGNKADSAPIAFFSSSQNPEDVQEVMRLGASDFRQKPVQFEALSAAVVDLVGRWSVGGSPAPKER